jgi:TRAP-type C4-dicarboxylate transport system permease large subunit
VARIALDVMVRPLVPFVLVILGCMTVVTYFPPLSMALRNLVY